ncbi:hypothetical protein [uncultured Acetobacteroides sp.]|uniref:hypothetical protein n=1 Tax=uncultured Acetobacteroides sp. TaxID=1760811 RepID=UPI0029F46D25|nr:hypothetical protein [uncultured Acetobacteroides sp.]
MGTASNTGHANNLANFKKIVGVTGELGAKYNPAQEMLKSLNLTKYGALGQKTLDDQQSAEAACSDAINVRFALFNDLDSFFPRVVSIYSISGVDAKALESIKAIARKMRPKSTSKKENKNLEATTALTTADAASAVTPETKPKARTASQLGYEDKASNFAQIASFVEANPKYAANEPELTKEGVRKYSDSLIAANDRCAAAEGALESARIERDRVFYTNPDSLYTIFHDIKRYVKGVFGSSSVEYKRISGIEFKLLTR